mmetsp:Transcript_12671/g.19808  ORF Transcript_12671/g.19808 Transcript_12671/m.19808 type:complete len:102 (-) Transcript_12671:660-965(-)
MARCTIAAAAATIIMITTTVVTTFNNIIIHATPENMLLTIFFLLDDCFISYYWRQLSYSFLLCCRQGMHHLNNFIQNKTAFSFSTTTIYIINIIIIYMMIE